MKSIGWHIKYFIMHPMHVPKHTATQTLYEANYDLVRCCGYCCCDIFGTHLYAEWLSFYANNCTATHSSHKQQRQSIIQLITWYWSQISIQSFCSLSLSVKWYVRCLFFLLFACVFGFICILTQTSNWECLILSVTNAMRYCMWMCHLCIARSTLWNVQWHAIVWTFDWSNSNRCINK